MGFKPFAVTLIFDLQAVYFFWTSLRWSFMDVQMCLIKLIGLGKAQLSVEDLAAHSAWQVVIRLKKLPKELWDRTVARPRCGKGSNRISAALKVSKSTVASIILALQVFGTTRTLLEAKLSHRGRGTSVRGSSTKSTQSRQPRRSLMAEWSAGSISSVQVIRKAAQCLPK